MGGFGRVWALLGVSAGRFGGRGTPGMRILARFKRHGALRR
jgi:hypothetical protein